MRKKILKNTSLVFAKRKTTVTKTKKRKINFHLGKLFLILVITFLCAGSVYSGYWFAKNNPAPFFMVNRVPKVLVQPLAQANENKISIEELLKEKDIEFEGVSYATTSATAIITLKKNSFVYLNTSENIQGQISVLSNVLKRLKIENPGKNISYIDLRFELPLIKF